MDHSKEIAVARASAARAADRAAVAIRPLTSTADSFVCETFLAEVWKTGPGCPPLAADVIKAMADAGSYVAGAVDGSVGGSVDGEELLAAAVGLWGPPQHPEMHSHIAGVREGARGRDVGFALKLDQRAHVLEQGVQEITWTFDPLQTRNAHFNFRKLGGTARDYLPDHYGVLPDGLNGSDETDRLLLRWDLLSERVRRACDEGRTAAGFGASLPKALSNEDERPLAHPVTADRVLVAAPTDIAALRSEQPALARKWRLALREVLGGLLADGFQVIDFDRVAGGYVLDREVAQ